MRKISPRAPATERPTCSSTPSTSRPNAGDLAKPNVTVLPQNGTAGLPFIGVDEQGRLVIEFVRRKASSNPGISYTVETGENLTNLQSLDLSGVIAASIDAKWERVTVIDPTYDLEAFRTLPSQDGSPDAVAGCRRGAKFPGAYGVRYLFVTCGYSFAETENHTGAFLLGRAVDSGRLEPFLTFANSRCRKDENLRAHG
ncbi:MAG: hypothetical protein LC642_06405 [Verrucomicrobiaceae bacterium]|nr:hypothetical protein [Verrucomicrobiaceae bacterium]